MPGYRVLHRSGARLATARAFLAVPGRRWKGNTSPHTAFYVQARHLTTSSPKPEPAALGSKTYHHSRSKAWPQMGSTSPAIQPESVGKSLTDEGAFRRFTVTLEWRMAKLAQGEKDGTLIA